MSHDSANPFSGFGVFGELIFYRRLRLSDLITAALRDNPDNGRLGRRISGGSEKTGAASAQGDSSASADERLTLSDFLRRSMEGEFGNGYHLWMADPVPTASADQTHTTADRLPICKTGVLMASVTEGMLSEADGQPDLKALVKRLRDGGRLCTDCPLLAVCDE